MVRSAPLSKTFLFVAVTVSSLLPTQSRPSTDVLLERTRREEATRLVRGRLKALSSVTGEEAHAKVKMLTAMLTEAIDEAAWYDAGGPKAEADERVTKPPPANQAQLDAAGKAWSEATAEQGFGEGTDVGAAAPETLDFAHDPVDCHAKSIMYTAKEGWGNQMRVARRMMMLADMTDRSLIMPPFLPHYTWRTWLHPNATSSNVLAFKGAKVKMPNGKFEGEGPSPYIPLDTLFDPAGTVLVDTTSCQHANATHPLICLHFRKLRKIVDKKRWTRVCSDEIPKKTYVQILGSKKVLLGDRPTGIESEPGLQYAAPFIREKNNAVVAVRAQDSHKVWASDLVWQSAHVGYMYRKELWAPVCRLAKELKPFTVAHIRAGDAKFKQRLMSQSSKHDHWGDQVKGMVKQMELLQERRHASGEKKKATKLVFITDTSTDQLWANVLTKSQAFKDLLFKRDADNNELGNPYKLMTTIMSNQSHGNSGGQQVRIKKRKPDATWPPPAEFEDNSQMTHVVHEMAEILRGMAEVELQPEHGVMQWPALLTLAAMVFDIMIAVLADIFSGNKESSFTLHIDVTRKVKATVGIDPSAFGGC